MAGRRVWVELFGIWVLSLAVRLAGASSIPAPEDWDSDFYFAVSRTIAAGGGPTIDAAWMLSQEPASLPAPADIYWMPLASRVLVPGWWIAGAAGAAAVPSVLASLVAPLTWLAARSLALGRVEAMIAVAAAVIGGEWGRDLAAVDVMASCALIGAVGFLGIVRGDARLSMVAAALAALARNDGWLLGLCLALGFRGADRAKVAVAGPLTTGAWLAWLVSQHGWLPIEVRALAGRVSSYEALFLGNPVEGLSVGARLGLIGAHLGDVGMNLANATEGFGLVAVAVVAFTRRGDGWVRAFLAAFLVTPLITLALAPTLVEHGTLSRFGAFLLLPHALALAVGVMHAGRWTAEHRDYPRWLVPALVAGGWAIVSVGVSSRQIGDRVQPRVPCEALRSGGAVFSSHPLQVTAECALPAVMLGERPVPEIQRLSDKFGVCVAWVPTHVDLQGNRADPEAVARLLPGWVQREPDVWASPRCARGAGAG